MGDEATTSTAQLERGQTVVRWALGACWVWVAPLGVVAAVVAYLSLLFSSFTAEALDGEVTVWNTVLVVGLPVLASLASAVAGFAAAYAVARAVTRLSALAGVPPWVLGLGAAGLGAVVAATGFWAALAAADGPGPRTG